MILLDQQPCDLCSALPCRCRDGRKVPVLKPEAILRLGALSLEAERSDAVEQLVNQQAEVYWDSSHEELVAALMDRDRLLANQGRQLADGRTASRLLREFMRASLNQADGVERRLAVDKVLKELGAEQADLRQVRLHGSTLGPLESPEAQAARQEDLASGRRKL